MNTLEFNLPGGFPLETDTLSKMQEGYLSLQAFGSAIGEYSIVKGCVSTGVNTSDGFVYINGELLEFRGGLTQDKVVINEERTRKQFKDGTEPEVIFERWVSFGTGTQAIRWYLFSRPKTTVELTKAQDLKASQNDLLGILYRVIDLENLLSPFHAGGAMVFWNKPASLIPDGWREVTAWRGRMPVGFDSSQWEFNILGETGGNKNKQLDISEMPSHNHAWGYQHGQATDNGLRRDGVYYSDRAQSSDNGIREINRYPLASAGGNRPFSILNPYRTVFFIEPTRNI